jgi:hypothetical protein
MLALKARDDFDRLCRFVKSLPSMKHPEVVQALQRFRAKQESFIAASPPDDDSDYGIEEQVYCADEAAIDLRKQAGTGIVSDAVKAQANELAKEAGITDAYAVSLLRRGVAKVLADRAEAEADELLDPLSGLGMSDGQFNSLINSPPTALTGSPVVISHASHQPPPVTLKQLIEDFLAAKKSETTPQTLSEYRRFLSLVQLLWGSERAVTDLGTADLKKLSDRMKVMRKHLKADTPVVEWDTDDPDKWISQKTRKKYFELVKSLIKSASQWATIPADFGAGYPCPKVKASGPAKERPPFSKADLAALFSSPLYSGCATNGHQPYACAQTGPHKRRDGFFWMAIIASLTGARSDELLQLRRCDVLDHQGVDPPELSA